MKKNQFKIGVVLAYILIFVNLIYGFFVSPFLIQKLTSANYGAYKTISSLIGTVSVLDFGISSTVIRYLSKFFSEKDEQSSKTFLGMIVYQAILIILVIATVGIVLYFCLDGIYGSSDLGINVDPGLDISKRLFLMLLVNTIIGVPYSIFNAIIVAHKDYFFANLSKILRIVFQFVALIIVVPLSFWNGSIISVGVVLISTSSLFLLIDMFYVIFKIKIKITLKTKLIPKWIIKESLVFTILSFIQMILIQFEGNIDNILIGKFISSEAVTTYSLAILFYSVFNQLSTAISNLLLPSVSQKIADGATNRDLENMTIKVGRIQFMLLGGALFGFVACGRLFISVWVGEEQMLVWILGIILMFATLLPLIENTALAVIRAKNKILFRTIVVFIGTIFNFSITFIAVSLLNVDYNIKLILACVGTAISLIGANVIAMNIYYKKCLGFRPIHIFKCIFNRTILCLIPPSILTFMFTLFLDNSWISFVCVVLLFVFIYACCLYFFGMTDDEKNTLLGKFLKFTNYKKYILSNGSKMFLFPDDCFSWMDFDKKKQLLYKNIKYKFKQFAFHESDGGIIYQDDICVVIDESLKDKYFFDNSLSTHDHKIIVIICHREFFKYYKQDYGVKTFLKSPLFSKNNTYILKPQKNKTAIKLSKIKIMKCVLISIALSCFSFGISYVTVDYSPEKVSMLIDKNYSQAFYCKMTPSSYPINPFLSTMFYANQASSPSLDYFYSRNYLKDNNSFYIYEKNDEFSPFQYRIANEYFDSTLISSNFVSLNDESCFSKMDLNLIASSDNYSDDEENVVVINKQLAINLFENIESAIDNNIDFYLYNFQKIRTLRKFRIVGVFEYINQNSYYSYNEPINLFVTNPKTVSMGWSGLEYLFTLPHDINSLDNSILKVFQIEKTYKYNHSFFAIESTNEKNSLRNVTSEIDVAIKKYDSPFTVVSIIGIIIAYLAFAYLFAKETFDIKNRYFETKAKRKICILTVALFLFLSLVADFVLLYALNIYFVWKIVLLPIIAFLTASFLLPHFFGIILKEFKK